MPKVHNRYHRTAPADAVYIGRLASGGFGVDRRKQFISDFKELVRLAQIGEEAVQNRGGR